MVFPNLTGLSEILHFLLEIASPRKIPSPLAPHSSYFLFVDSKNSNKHTRIPQNLLLLLLFTFLVTKLLPTISHAYYILKYLFLCTYLIVIIPFVCVP